MLLDSRVQKKPRTFADMTLRLQNRTALVTGSTSNIGRAIAVALAAEGAHVIVSGRDVDRGAEVVAAIRADGGDADFVRADLTGDPAASHALAAETLELTGGRLDILVNNAGVYPLHATEDAGADLFDHIYGVNVKAPFHLVQALVPHLSERRGVILNLGSWVARLAVPSSPLYSSSKAAMEALTRAWSAELGPRGIRVLGVSPGVIRPLGADPEEPHASDALMATAPSGRAGDAHDIAAAAVYLVSDEASFVHGTTLDVDGGRANVVISADRPAA